MPESLAGPDGGCAQLGFDYDRLVRNPFGSRAGISVASLSPESLSLALAPLRRLKPVMRAEAGCCFGWQVAAKDRLFESLHNLDDDSIELHAPGGLIGTFNLFGGDPDLMAWSAPELEPPIHSPFADPLRGRFWPFLLERSSRDRAAFPQPPVTLRSQPPLTAVSRCSAGFSSARRR